MIHDQNLSGAYGEPVMVLSTGRIISSSQQPQHVSSTGMPTSQMGKRRQRA